VMRLKTPASLSFLEGGGEMGTLIRARDWSATSLGAVERWPQSLRTAVSMLLPSKAQIILFWGPQFVVFYNDAYRPVFGAKHPEALGLPGSAAWSEIWDTQLHALLAGVVSSGEAFWASDLLFMLERHGFLEETYFDVSYDPVRVESGAVGGVYCIVTETTGRVIGERRLALLRDLASCNAAARSAREACALAMDALAARPQDVAFALAFLDEELQACTPAAQEKLRETPPGLVQELSSGPCRLVVGLNPQRPFDEQYRGFLWLVADSVATGIANARAYEQEKTRAEALAEIDRAKTAFFSNVSHEFRTPLTLMLGPLEDLLQRRADAMPAASREALEVVQRNGQRLLKLVNTLLDFARIEAGRARASYEPVDLAALTAELAANFRSACERAGLRLEVDCPPCGEPAYVDREMWEKIVLNLLSNAFKFTFEGAISVSLRREQDFVLEVRDTGSGIPAAELARMFERFHRVEGARGRSHEGSGIGLALVQELAKMHGGSISVESEVGRGSVFRVRIPRGAAHLARERVKAPREPASTAVRASAYVAEALSWLPGTQDIATRHAGKRVLLADDNADLREYVRRLLAEHYEVEAVADGQSALAAARARRPDLVVTDVMMPRLDGFALISELRADEALRDVPVIALSARAGEEARLEGLDRGADEYLVKPFSARELLVRVGTLLRSTELRQRAQEQLRDYLEGLLEGFVAYDENWVMTYINAAGERLLGRRREEVLGKTWHQAFPHAVGNPVDQMYQRVMRTRQAESLEYDYAHYGRSFEIGASPVRSGGVAVYFRDITERRRAEEALRESDRRKDDFMAMLAHELRNPLAPIRNGLHLLQLSGSREGGLAPIIEMIERQVSQLVRLTDDLLEMSRITRGVLELRRERVQAQAVARNAVETAEPAIRAAGHRLTLDLPPEPLWVEGDPVRLAQILANLLNNAARYTDHGGSIRLTARRDGAHAAVSVRDNGAGIPREQLGKVFEMFTRGERSTGLGIGLALARSLAAMHGGTVQAASEGSGKGAEFTLRLPLASGEQSLSAPPAREMPGLAPRRILVVDDNRDAADSLGMLLRFLGADVQVAHGGHEALDAFEAYQPSVVLLDIGMPGMDGYQVARAIRGRENGAGVPLVALTGWGQEEDRRRSREAGFDHHLIKPADIAALQSLLASLEAP
jgi:PAS domain S-box-containing protein